MIESLTISICESDGSTATIVRGKNYKNNNAEPEECMDKLGQLEAIEKELGISFEVLNKAKNGIWVYTFNGYDYNGSSVYVPIFVKRTFCFCFVEKCLFVPHQKIERMFEDFNNKKSALGWALNKKDLKSYLKIKHGKRDD